MTFRISVIHVMIVTLFALTATVHISAFIVSVNQDFPRRVYSNSRKQLSTFHPWPSLQLWAKKPNSRKTKKSVASNSGFASKPPKDGDSQVSKHLRSISSQNAGSGQKALRQAALAFDRIRKDFTGSEHSRDVYVRSPLNSATTFWFVGKVAFENLDDATFACLSQKRLMFEYSMQNLRPQNLGGVYAKALELWLAPADSEMDVVQNKVTLEHVVGSAADLSENFDVSTVGYNPEIYVGDEVTKGGLRVERDENGCPTKPVFDINQSA